MSLLTSPFHSLPPPYPISPPLSLCYSSRPPFTLPPPRPLSPKSLETTAQGSSECESLSQLDKAALWDYIPLEMGLYWTTEVWEECWKAWEKKDDNEPENMRSKQVDMFGDWTPCVCTNPQCIFTCRSLTSSISVLKDSFFTLTLYQGQTMRCSHLLQQQNQ